MLQPARNKKVRHQHGTKANKSTEQRYLDAEKTIHLEENMKETSLGVGIIFNRRLHKNKNI